jgi:hypothetical protein
MGATMTECIVVGWKVQPVRQQQEWYWINPTQPKEVNNKAVYRRSILNSVNSTETLLLHNHDQHHEHHCQHQNADHS